MRVIRGHGYGSLEVRAAMFEMIEATRAPVGNADTGEPDVIAPEIAQRRVFDTGAETLRVMTQAPNYNRWVAERLAPWMGQRILEVGAGVGTMTQLFLRRQYLLATDMRPDYLSQLRHIAARCPNVDVARLQLPTVNPELSARGIDTVVMINVLEHIEDDAATMRALNSILVSGGRVVVFVPAVSALYGSLDRALGHYRRYRKRDLQRLAAATGFVVEHLAYFNFLGLFGWWLNSRISRRRVLPEKQVRWFDLCVPLLRRLDKLAPPVGLSLLMVSRKAAAAYPEERPTEIEQVVTAA